MVTRGFTLLEMMLVIVLLGTVTSMIVPTLSSGTKPVAHGAAATFGRSGRACVMKPWSVARWWACVWSLMVIS